MKTDEAVLKHAHFKCKSLSQISKGRPLVHSVSSAIPEKGVLQGIAKCYSKPDVLKYIPKRHTNNTLVCLLVQVDISLRNNIPSQCPAL